MKTPKEKAKELIDKFTVVGLQQRNEGIACALICVDENVKMLKLVLNESTEIYLSLNTPKKLCIDVLNPLLNYWQEVKSEIEKL